MQPQTTDTPDTATFVLLHGAWHGAWCWKHVSGRLRAAGHNVYTPTLTGLGERSHLLGPDITLETCAQDLINVFLWEELRDVVLATVSAALPPVQQQTGFRTASNIWCIWIP
jgi:hypothetical protein